MNPNKSRARKFSIYSEDGDDEEIDQEVTRYENVSDFTFVNAKEMNGKRQRSQNVNSNMRCDSFEPFVQNQGKSNTTSDIDELRKLNCNILSESEMMKQVLDIENFLGIKK
jgi:hypothetical protein